MDLTSAETSSPRLKATRLSILVSRPDRLGDVILSTPVLEAIKKNHAQAHVSFLVHPAYACLFENSPWVDRVISVDRQKIKGNFKEVYPLSQILKSYEFDIAICLHSDPWVDAAIQMASIPKRIGPYSKWYSYLFYNRGIRQHRSQVQMHESNYSLQLLEKMDLQPFTQSYNPHVALIPEDVEWAKKWLMDLGWQEGAPIIGVHPGMGGSALNWPLQNYAQTIRALVDRGVPVLVSAGPADQESLKNLQKNITSSQVFWFDTECEDIPSRLSILAGAYSHLSGLLAPSTGPLHLGVALGLPVVSIYPPIRVQSVDRWGPYRNPNDMVKVMTPEVECGQVFECIGERCPYYACMETVAVDRVVHQLMDFCDRKVD